MAGIKFWNGSAWETIPLGVPVYEQPGDPGAVPNGSIWIDTDAVAPTPPVADAVIAKLSTNRVVGAGVNQYSVPLDGADEEDTAGFHSPTVNPSRITIPTGFGGLYAMTAWLEFTPGTGGVPYMVIWKNGNTALAAHDFGPPSTRQTFPSHARLVAGDYIELIFNNTTGGALTITFARMSAVRVGS